tara:strand:- start:120 stop:566 length:447 start_codon:yes stop_codon:yes gene_type:complete
MLAELSAANAAFAVIKQAISNGRDIASVGSQIAKFVDGKEDLQRKVINKKNSPFYRGNDFEEFMALEAIKEKEEELKQIMLYVGRPGLWNDWLRFQVEARKARQEAEEAARKRKQQILETIVLSVACIVGLSIFAVIIYFGMKARGML